MFAMPDFPYRALLRESLATRGWLGTTAHLLRGGFELVRDCLPARRRLRYGDIDFDCDYRVNTTWANVPLGTRIREVFAGRQYQPSDPSIFHEMMSHLPIDHRQFTFLDLGSGKGRALLLASDYPFRRIVGVELLPELHAIAEENVRKYHSERQQCREFELVCADARTYTPPPEPLVVFLFDPFREEILRQVMAGIERSSREQPRKVFIAYENPVSERVLVERTDWRKLAGTQQWAVYEGFRL
jgi:SAM-dependent methyltransferase